jgi:membrane protein YdbS with pleckstrin-like domain
MTNGGDSAHGDGTDRVAEDHSEPTAVQGESNLSAATDGHATRSSADGAEQGGSAVSTLAEPTRAGLAKTQSRTATLERGPITEYTTDRRSLDSAVQIQWTIRVSILAVVLGAIFTAILSSFQVPIQFGLLGIGLLLAVGLVWVVLSYRIWTYQIRDDSLYLERGVVTHVRTIVPYVRIQHVDTSRSALERALVLSTLVVYTAGSRGADVSVPGLKPHEARDLQRRLKELAIEADGDDAL